MKIDNNFLEKILVNSELIAKEDFDRAEKDAQSRGVLLQDALVDLELIDDEQLTKLIADEIKFPAVNLEKVKINKDILFLVPELVAKKKEIIVFDRTKDGLKLAMTDPFDLDLRGMLEKKTGEMVIPYYTSRRSVFSVLKFYKKEIKEEFEDIIGKNLEEFQKTKTKAPQSLPIIRMVEMILTYGYENKASDIHMEPYRDKTILRYRIDGVLHDVLTLSREIHDFLVARLKIIAKLRTDEHQASQDGHFFLELEEAKVDVRVSIVPIEEGEKVVMRLLAEGANKFELVDLGFRGRDMDLLQRNIKKPWGMILTTGPTGSGKTTSLYAVLKILNTRDVNICTIEDPVEYDIEGINQIQVNPKTNLTFLEGLKAIVRQDPDVIMVGEIRDPETSQLAINAAMTGHLVLSTFHATDASTVLIRLLDMGIEPFLITSTVNLIISQRLVRKICPRCIESFELHGNEILDLLPSDLYNKFMEEKEKITVFKGKGCSLCQNSGYLGRMGIFEVMEMSDEIKDLVMKKENALQIKNKAIELGMTTMIEDGLSKVKEGKTTLEEVLRAIRQ